MLIADVYVYGSVYDKYINLNSLGTEYIRWWINM